jgi:hypothetical protein
MTLRKFCLIQTAIVVIFGLIIANDFLDRLPDAPPQTQAAEVCR